MNTKRIHELIDTRECFDVEFKEARSELPKTLFETVCAFLNMEGGTILLGVTDSGSVCGVDPEAVERMKQDLANLSNNPQKLDPPFLLFPHDMDVDGKTVIAVQVPVSSQVHRCNGTVYLRSEDGDYGVSGVHQIAGLFNRKLSVYTEQRVYPHITKAQLRVDLFDKAKRLMLAHHPEHPWVTMTFEELLQVAGFVRNDSATGKTAYTLAAVLLFGTDEAIHCVAPGYKFDALLRRENIDRYDDRLTVRTNLIEAHDLLMGFVEKHLNDPFFLEGDMRISLRAKIFREVISNIIAHREYTSAAAATLRIYQDRVELLNPNNPHGFGLITSENLVPFPKNPTICKFLIQLGRFDELGSGVININRYLPLYAKGAHPTFREGNMFTTILPLTSEPVEVAGEHVTPQVTPHVTPQVTPHVTPQVMRLLNACSDDSGRSALQEALELADREHFRKHYLQPALEEKLIEMTIPDKPRSSKQKYRLTEEGKVQVKRMKDEGGSGKSEG